MMQSSKLLAPDQRTRDEALDISRSFIVQAPAGSGKTELLTERYVRLLSVAQAPSEIVAITFTRKAAAEMRDRIAKRLREATPGTAAAAAQAKFPQLLAQPEFMRVVTFDTLFRSLTRMAPLTLNIASDAAIDEAPQARYTRAAQEALSDAEIAPQATRLLRRFDGGYESAVHAIAQLLARRDQWLPLSYQVDPDAQAWLTKVQRLLTEESQFLFDRTRAAVEQSLSPTHIAQWLGLAQFANDNLQAAFTFGPTLPPARMDAAPLWDALFEILYTKKFTVREKIDKRDGFPADAKAEKAAWQQMLLDMDVPALLAMRPYAEAIRGIPRLDPLAEDAATLHAVITVLTRATAYLQLDFTQSNSVDFIEIALGAQRGVVGDDAVLREPLTQSTRHVLVDEFQDTSITQFNFLEGVVRAWGDAGDSGRTMFCVGDPMQSIYRFRQAEVALFAQVQTQGIAGHRLEPVTLSANFRSDASIVDWVNQHVEPAIAQRNAFTRTPIHFAKGQAVRRSDAPVPIICNIFDSTRAEAKYVAQTVEATLRETTDSVAILVPKRAAGHAIAQALIERGVGFSARDTQRLADASWVGDLLSITYALSEPADSLSWLALLRAPWCGLQLRDLTALSRVPIVWSALQDLGSLSFSDDGRRRVEWFVSQMQPCMRALGQRSLADVVEATWARLHAREVTPATSREDFEAVIETIRAHERGGRVWDRDELEAAIGRIEPVLSAQAESHRVQIMTVHKAKGLQFDTVFVAAMGSKGAADRAQLLHWLRGPSEALIVAKPFGKADPLSPLYDWLKSLNEYEQAAERGRLLYVATTRPKRRLILTASAAFDEISGEPILTPGTLLECLSAGPAFQTHRDRPASIETQTVASPKLVRRDKMPAVAADSVPRVVKVPVRQSEHERLSRGVGVVLHAWLAVHGNRTPWSPAAQQWAREALRKEGVVRETLAQGALTIKLGVERVREDASGAFVFDPDHRAWDELSFAQHIEIEQQARVLRPDRVLCTRDGQWWVIDYKTALPSEMQTRAQFVAEQVELYREKMAQYVEAVRAWQHLDANAPVHSALYFVLLGELVTL